MFQTSYVMSLVFLNQCLLLREIGLVPDRVKSGIPRLNRETTMKFFNKLLRDEQGATAIEYGLIAALIAVAAIVAMGASGQPAPEHLHRRGDRDGHRLISGRHPKIAGGGGATCRPFAVCGR